MIHWKDTGNKSWSDGNISRRYTDGFPCMISVTYVYVHVGEGYGSRKALSWESQSHPELGAAPGSAQPLQTPWRARKSLLSLALILQFEKELLVSAQVSFLFLGSYSLKNSHFYFSFKGKSWYSSTKNRALIIIYSETINPIILYLFFSLTCFVLVEYI